MQRFTEEVVRQRGSFITAYCVGELSRTVAYGG